ncbi:MAG: VacJ family lipoprotein [Sedimentisphaerales bacterium]|nr:VacJ family lipoprotein [Sedimentisphaerales bacterium]
MKSNLCLILIMALATMGCSAAKKNAADKTAPVVAENAPESSPDDEFGLLEDELDEQQIKISDPLRPFNKAMFNVNDKLYLWVIDPFARGCKRVVPEPARVSIRHFFNNIAAPARFVNCHLQGKHKAAGRELHRFAYNTTFGILGFSDPARTKLGLEPAEEDLGQTLAKYGAGTGIYIVLPVLGPSNARDAIGMIGDQFLNPVRYVRPRDVSIAISASRIANENTFRIGEYKSLKDASYDPYVAMRQAYLQYRDKKVKE